MKTINMLLLIMLCFPASAFELVTEITRDGETTRLQTSGYARLSLLKEAVSLKGPLMTSGKLSIKGRGNIVMWSRVDGAYYFSKIPELQNVEDTDNLDFSIPFDAAEKTVTEVVIEVEMLTGGSISISDLRVGQGRQDDQP
jgi:hypothetical protein